MTDELDFASASQALAGLDQLDVPAMELMYKLECSGEAGGCSVSGAGRTGSGFGLAMAVSALAWAASRRRRR